jgi:uncharacterized protein YaaN involved in tellurite resistance
MSQEQEAKPVVSPTSSAPAESIAIVATAPEAQLPMVDPALVARLKTEIQIDERARIANFGDKAQRSVTGYADRVLAQTKTQELGETGKLLNDILLKAKGLDAASLKKGGLLQRFTGGFKARVEKFRMQFESVSGQIQGVSIQLEKRKDVLRRDIAMMDDLHDQTKASINELEAYITAGKQFVEEFKTSELPKLKARAEAAAAASTDGGGLMEAQEFRDAEQALDRLEKRVFYLQQARTIGIQQLPQIRIVQSADETLIENLNASIRLTIPVWKQKMVLLLGLTRQQEALELQKTVTDATNEMLRQASGMMKEQAISIEEQAQRGIVDLETLEQTNSDLIDTINGVIQVQQDGRAKRAAVEARMQELTVELREALVKADAEA